METAPSSRTCPSWAQLHHPGQPHHGAPSWGQPHHPGQLHHQGQPHHQGQLHHQGQVHHGHSFIMERAPSWGTALPSVDNSINSATPSLRITPLLGDHSIIRDQCCYRDQPLPLRTAPLLGGQLHHPWTAPSAVISHPAHCVSQKSLRVFPHTPLVRTLSGDSPLICPGSSQPRTSTATSA